MAVTVHGICTGSIWQRCHFRQSSLAIHRTFRGPGELLSILVSFSKQSGSTRHERCGAVQCLSLSMQEMV